MQQQSSCTNKSKHKRRSSSKRPLLFQFKEAPKPLNLVKQKDQSIERHSYQMVAIVIVDTHAAETNNC